MVIVSVVGVAAVIPNLLFVVSYVCPRLPYDGDNVHDKEYCHYCVYPINHPGGKGPVSRKRFVTCSKSFCTFVHYSFRVRYERKLNN